MEHTIFRRIIITMLMAALTAIFLLPSGCNSKVNEKPEKSEKSEEYTPMRIVFWNLYYNTQNERDRRMPKDQLFVNKSARKFEELNPSIEVEILTPPMDIYFNLLKAACEAKNGPDIAMMWSGGPLMDYVKYFIPLDKYYTLDELNELTGWELCRENFEPDGKIMGIPVGLTPALPVYYNKMLFRKVGINTERKPETWEELLDLCKELKKNGVQPFVIGEKEGWNTAWVMGQLWNDMLSNEDIMDIRKGAVKFSDNKSIKQAYYEWKKIFDFGYANKDTISITQAEGQARFLKGEAAMQVGVSYIASDVYSALGNDADWFPIPHIKKDAPYINTFLGGYSNNCFSITNYSENPDACIQFIKYMTSYKTMDLFVDECQFEFSNNKSSKKPDFTISNPILQEIYDYMKYSNKKGVYQPDSILQGSLCQSIYSMNGQIFCGKISVEDAMEKFDQVLEKILE